MAWQLMVEVLDHAPPACGPAERLVLLAIAEAVHTERRASRRCTTSVAELARRTGLRPASVTDTLTRLRQRHGLDVRVSIGTDRRGMPIYATPGRVPLFELPHLPPPADCPCTGCSQAAAGSVLADPAPPVADPGSVTTDPGSVTADPSDRAGSVSANAGSATADPHPRPGSASTEAGSVPTDPGSAGTDPYREPGDREGGAGSAGTDPDPARTVSEITGGRRFDRGDGRRPVYRCHRHTTLPLTVDQPCAACREVRELAQADERRRSDVDRAERAARARSARVCPDCAGTGYAPVPGDDNTVARCHHPRLDGPSAVAS